jgi:hypothetical protein
VCASQIDTFDVETDEKEGAVYGFVAALGLFVSFLDVKSAIKRRKRERERERKNVKKASESVVQTVKYL